MSLQTIKVSDNDIVVEKANEEKIPVKGGDWFSEPYANILALAKKKTGKTTVIKNILKRCSGANTKFIFIVSTIERDPTWKTIVEYWENKGHEVATFGDIKEDGEDIIKSFLDSNRTPEEAQLGGSAPVVIAPAPKVLVTRDIRQSGSGAIEEKPKVQTKPKKPKFVSPDWIIVCDDLGDSMRNKYLTQLLKTNRHYKSKVILAAQNITDLMPAAIRQLDYVLAFGRIPLDKIEKLREDLMIDLTEDDFKRLYEDATAQPHQFLYIGRTASGDEFRKGFTEKYMIN